MMDTIAQLITLAGFRSPKEKESSKDIVAFANCCCGIFSLRQGNFLLALYLLICGVAEVASSRWSGMLVIISAGFGVLASSKRDSRLSQAYFYSLIGVFTVKVILFIFVDTYEMSEHLIVEECKAAQNVDACERYLRTMMKQTLSASRLLALAILVFIYAWSGGVAFSYMRVLEEGGTGDEKLSVDALGRIEEREKLVNV